MTSPAAAVCPAGPAPLSPPPWAAQPCSALPWHWLPAPALANPIPAAQRHGGLSLAWVYFVVPVLAVCFFRWGHLALCILICPLQYPWPNWGALGGWLASPSTSQRVGFVLVWKQAPCYSVRGWCSKHFFSQNSACDVHILQFQRHAVSAARFIRNENCLVEY